MGAGHTHGSGHGHAHSHAHATPDSDRRWLAGALAVIVVFLLGEVVVGVVAGSLALLSDAAHMLTDAASIALALWAIRLAARPPAGRMTFGWKRVEILSAQANGLTLLVLSAWLFYEAIRRLIQPPSVTGELVLATALVGVVVNLAATWMISRANRSSLNVEGAFQHILTDLYAFLATAVAGVIIMVTGFERADAIATLVVVALMVKAGVGLVRASSRIFLEAAPADIDPAAVGVGMAARDGWSRCTTCTSGKSPRGLRRSRRTCWSSPAATVMRCVRIWRSGWPPTITSSTPRCRWITHSPN